MIHDNIWANEMIKVYRNKLANQWLDAITLDCPTWDDHPMFQIDLHATGLKYVGKPGGSLYYSTSFARTSSTRKTLRLPPENCFLNSKSGLNLAMASIHLTPPLVIAAGAVWPPLCAGLVALRFVARTVTRAPLRIDDWLVLPALVSLNHFLLLVTTISLKRCTGIGDRDLCCNSAR